MSEQPRLDSLDSYYAVIKVLNKIGLFLFWIMVALSMVQLYYSKLHILNMVFLILSLIYFILNTYVSYWYLPNTEEKRMAHLLSNSFRIAFNDEQTNRYYNNDVTPSILKLGINTFENTLFTSQISRIMAKKSSLIVLTYLIIWFIIILYRDSSLELISVIGQTIFTSHIITNVLKECILYVKTQRLQQEFYTLFLQCDGQFEDNRFLNPKIIELVTKYETLKSSMAVSLDTNIFNKINQKTSSKWERIKKQLKID
ncbi:hypothetical protein MOE15_00525 [Bacillus atrophaeus]|uniref:hypothetical protein n=1 Tax=Bacillus atrophaeus TaxID=1452 RepID=UPI0022816A7E|nr:hypothetical protein [Bacillus atrophaeus]MCY8807028.1 hypothetical protein [Bacillus atrophaeus]